MNAFCGGIVWVNGFLLCVLYDLWWIVRIYVGFCKEKGIVVKYRGECEWNCYDWLCNQSWKWNVMSYKVDGCDETLVDWMLLKIVDWWIVWVINCVESYDCNCELR